MTLTTIDYDILGVGHQYAVRFGERPPYVTSNCFGVSTMKLRFSLRAALLATTVVCVLLGYKLKTAQDRRSAVLAIEALNGSYGYSVEGPDWLRSFVGDEKLFYSLGRVTFWMSSSSGDDDIDPFDDDSLAEAVPHLNVFPAFRDLNLLSCSVTDEGLKQLKLLKNLRDLNLGGSSGISDDGLDVLAGIDSLRRINVQATAVTPEGVRRFRKNRPDCKVTCDEN